MHGKEEANDKDGSDIIQGLLLWRYYIAFALLVAFVAADGVDAPDVRVAAPSQTCSQDGPR